MAQKGKGTWPKMGRFELPESLIKVINVKREDGSIAKRLQEVSDQGNAVLLAFIAPYAGVRVSPVEERGAAIRMPEEWGIEYVLSEVEKQCAELNKLKLYLLVNSPGGVPECCYNIAHMIQAYFSDIKVFIPQVALSGGTLLALTGNKLVMGAASRLSPIDVQVAYGNSTVSAYSMGKALSRLEHYFSTRTVDEAAYPYRAMADKLDPVILEDWTTSLLEIGGYAHELLEAAKYPKEKRETIIKELVLTDKTHSYVIHRERAVSLGLNVSRDEDDSAILNIMRQWLGTYAFEKEMTHCIRYVLPARRSNERRADQEKGEPRKGNREPSVTSKSG